MSFQLRVYQAEAIEGVRQALRDGHRRIVLSIPTGGGKTECAMAIIKAAVEKESSASFIADRQNLVWQTSDRFTQAGIRHGILMGNHTVGVGEPVRVESVQTIQSRGLRSGTKLFVMDECHEMRPAIIWLIEQQNAILIGLTATPFPAAMAAPVDAHLPKAKRRPDAPPRYTAMVSTVTTDQLISEGWLCPFDVIAPEAVVDTSGLPIQGGEYNSKELSERVQWIVEDIVPNWRRVLNDRFGGVVQPTIVFAVSVDDAELILQEFRDDGIDARIVSSREEDNATTIEAFRRGDFDVIVNCAVLSRGSDFPRAVILIDAYPMRKILTPIQRYGRVMRTFPGKEKAIVIDMTPNWLRMRQRILKFYTQGPEWPPPEWVTKAAKEKDAEKDAICPECRHVLPPAPDNNVCPNCGWMRPKRTYGGEGVKLQRVNGELKCIDSLTGEVTQYGGELWAEVCTEAMRLAKGDKDRAKKRALAAFKAITGSFPKQRNMDILDRPPDPAVADLMRRNFQAWLIARKHSEANA